VPFRLLRLGLFQQRELYVPRDRRNVHRERKPELLQRNL
jgi:hypothetical protein